MNTAKRSTVGLPPDQQAIREKCFHPTGTFIEFDKFAVEQSISDRFEEQVRKYPNRLALKSKRQAVTYDQLNRVANRLARTILAERKEGSEPIAMLLEHGIQVVVAILAALKAGKICVPLDPSHPTDRISRILEDSQARLILADSSNLTIAADVASQTVQVINIEEIEQEITEDNPGLSLRPGDLAAILYTSGSTGAPKGVAHSQRSLLHMARTDTNGRHISPEDRISLIYSMSASGGFRDGLGALLNGAALFPYDLKTEGVAKLGDWVAKEKLTIFRLPVSVFRQLVTTLSEGENFPMLRMLHIGAETVYSSDFESYQNHFSKSCIFSSTIGSTEINPLTFFLGDKNTKIARSTVPVGYPVEGVEVLLLDEFQKEVGINEIGEIVAKSRYLAQGYWNNEDLTGTKFLSDPQGKDQRIYLTGDLGRILTDGCLIHLGRKDSQVKIRGNKVFPSEVESRICDLEGITAAAVIAREDGKGNSRLMAYVTIERTTPTIVEMRGVLSQKLPAYMVPSTFVVLNQLPLLPNGKVDRLALPEPTKARPHLNSVYVAPRTPLETELAKIWSEVLDLELVGINDSFLDLGGNSLLASQVIAQVIKTFRVEVPFRSLWESPTIADMAVLVVQDRLKSADPSDIERMLGELEFLPEASS